MLFKCVNSVKKHKQEVFLDQRCLRCLYSLNPTFMIGMCQYVQQDA